MSDAKTTGRTEPASTPLKAYTTPRLAVYGSLTDLTRAVGNKSTMDGGSTNGMKNSQ